VHNVAVVVSLLPHCLSTVSHECLTNKRIPGESKVFGLFLRWEKNGPSHSPCLGAVDTVVGKTFAAFAIIFIATVHDAYIGGGVGYFISALTMTYASRVLTLVEIGERDQESPPRDLLSQLLMSDKAVGFECPGYCLVRNR
jgi:hypothetical protein